MKEFISQTNVYLLLVKLVSFLSCIRCLLVFANSFTSYIMNVEKEHFFPTNSDPLDPETPYGPDPDDCQCNELGSVDLTCNCGKCLCKTNVVGDTCDQCEIEHYDFPNCKGRYSFSKFK